MAFSYSTALQISNLHRDLLNLADMLTTQQQTPTYLKTAMQLFAFLHSQ